MIPKTGKTKALYVTAALVLLATLGTWMGTGAHRGWTRTSVTDMQHDDVTGIDYPVERKKFVAGVELLAVGVGFAGALALTALWVQRCATKS